MARPPPPIRHTLRVPRGYENSPHVLLTLATLEIRYGKDNVELIVEEPPDDPDRAADEPPDLSPRRIVRVTPDEDE